MSADQNVSSMPDEYRFWAWAWFAISMELAVGLVVIVGHYEGWF